MGLRWLAVVWMLLGLHTAAAEEPQVVLPEVVVTATRTQTPVDELPSSITVIRDSDIEQRADGTATDAPAAVSKGARWVGGSLIGC